MKILLLVTGQIREDYVKTYESLNNEILSKYDCDIYMSVWDNDPNIDECIKLYNPKKVKIDIGLSRDEIWTTMIQTRDEAWNSMIQSRDARITDLESRLTKIESLLESGK